MSHLTVDQRITILLELREFLKTEYIGWDYKARRIGLNTYSLFADAIDIERVIRPASSTIEQAQIKLEFLDRLQRLIARFKDSHLKLRLACDLPSIYLGFHVRPAGDRLVVTRLDKQSLETSASKFGHNNSLSIGDELWEIDGRPAKEKLAELLPFAGASSPEIARRRAAAYLTYRWFRYPPENYCHCGFISKRKEPHSVMLQWYKSDNFTNWDAECVLAARSISTLSKAICDSDNQTRAQLQALEGCREMLDEKSNPPNFQNVVEFFKAPDLREASLVTGYWTDGQRTYGVVRIHEMVEELFTFRGRASFADDLAAFLLEVRRRELPLILDIRFNTGGRGELAMFVASFFVSPAESQSSCSVTLNMNEVLREATHRFGSAKGAASVPPAFKMCNPLVTCGPEIPIQDARVFYFGLPSVCLISPGCGSAGEVLAWLLKYNKHVVLVGSQTHGAGFGFRRSSVEAKRKVFLDSLGTIACEVPNQAWARPSKGAYRRNTYKKFWRHLIENVPVSADVMYEPSPMTCLDNCEGWFRKAAEVLKRKVM